MRGLLVLLFLTHHHALIPGAALKAVTGIRGWAHGGGDGRWGEGLRPR
jgi:hypothetical protein